MSRLMTKPTKWVCAQQRLRSAWASTQSDQSSLCTQWVAKDPRFLHVDSKDSDQTGQMPRLIWVFTGSTITLLVLSCRGSNLNKVFYNFLEINWAVSWQNRFMSYVNNEDADQPAHQHTLISIFVICWLDSIISRRIQNVFFRKGCGLRFFNLVSLISSWVSR